MGLFPDKEVIMADLAEIAAIKRLKYKYLRCLDCKLWEEMAECFTEDATTSYSGGKYSFQGRAKIIEFLKQGLGNSRPSMHQAHQPEIDITSPTTAKGTWALEDYVIDTKTDTSIRGSAFYHDEYVKVKGEWKIKSTGYDRVFEELWSRKETPSLKLTQNMFAGK